MNNVAGVIAGALAALALLIAGISLGYQDGKTAVIESCTKHGVYATKDVGMVCHVSRGERL